ncbi:FMN-binding domain-containing protein [Collinsella sp. An307]|nr:FMN-binding domain-containing protein [Collinsella sp. An307]
MARHRNGSLYAFVTVLIAAVVCGGVLGFAYYQGQWATTAFADADARLDEAQGGAQRALLFPDAASFEKLDAPAIDGLNSAYVTDAGDYVFDVQSAGYHGDVELMIGIASDGTVAGIQIVSEDETDGIGTNALTEDYFGTFTGLAAEGTLTVEEPGSGETQVDGVSGATFTSTAVVTDLNIAFEAYAQLGGN